MAHRIVLVDDDEYTLRVLAYNLTHQGYEVACASDGEAAWQMIAQAPPDLLVTDWALPELDGLGLLARIGATPATADIPIILISGEELLFSLEHVQDRLGIVALMSKPVDPHELSALIGRTLRGAAPPKSPCDEETLSAVVNAGEVQRQLETLAAWVGHVCNDVRSVPQ
jgi:DNA-binding response OmpR family regulator